MKIEITVKLAALALAALKIRAFEAEAHGRRNGRWRTAYNDLTQLVNQALGETLQESDELLKLTTLEH